MSCPFDFWCETPTCEIILLLGNIARNYFNKMLCGLKFEVLNLEIYHLYDFRPLWKVHVKKTTCSDN